MSLIYGRFTPRSSKSCLFIRHILSQAARQLEYDDMRHKPLAQSNVSLVFITPIADSSMIVPLK